MRHGAFVLLLVPASLAAQAPHITPAGDPSVRNDTIYSLAVDSTQHEGNDRRLEDCTSLCPTVASIPPAP